MSVTNEAAPISAREQRLLSVLRSARRRSGVAVTERWLLGAGGGLVVVGLVLVLIGWVGTSRTVLVAGQIPYVVSGGLLGLGLVFLGAFLYFGYWLALLVREGQARAEQDRADLARISAELGDVNRSLGVIADLLRDATADGPSGPVRSRARG